MKTKDGFIRDEKNLGAILNTDNNSLKSYKLKKQKQKEFDDLKTEVSDIKNMLTTILEKLK